TLGNCSFMASMPEMLMAGTSVPSSIPGSSPKEPNGNSQPDHRPWNSAHSLDDAQVCSRPLDHRPILTDSELDVRVRRRRASAGSATSLPGGAPAPAGQGGRGPGGGWH